MIDGRDFERLIANIRFRVAMDESMRAFEPSSADEEKAFEAGYRAAMDKVVAALQETQTAALRKGWGVNGWTSAQCRRRDHLGCSETDGGACVCACHKEVGLPSGVQ